MGHDTTVLLAPHEQEVDHAAIESREEHALPPLIELNAELVESGSAMEHYALSAEDDKVNIRKKNRIPGRHKM